jgi:hypothetical protein
MLCPTEIAEVVLPILQNGLLRLRASAWQGETDLCRVESDHIHNLPDLLADYHPEKLQYYWSVERPEYVRHVGADRLDGWEELWRRLGERIDQEPALLSHH